MRGRRALQIAEMVVAAVFIVACGSEASDRTPKKGFGISSSQGGGGGSTSSGTDTDTGTGTAVDGACVDGVNYTGTQEVKWGLPETTPSAGTCDTASDGDLVEGPFGPLVCVGGKDFLTITSVTAASFGAKITSQRAIFLEYKDGGATKHIGISLTVSEGDPRTPANTLWIDGGCASTDTSFEGNFSLTDATETIAGDRSLCSKGDARFTGNGIDNAKIIVGSETICGPVSIVTE